VKIIILLNPAARRGKARQLLTGALRIFREQQIDFEVRESQDATHLEQLARAAGAEHPDLIVSAGGDGTHHYVINGMFRSGVPLGLLPLGTGNDLPTALGLPVDASAAAATIMQGQVREIDLAQTGAAVYAGIAGMGFDSTVTRYANEHAQWLGGPAAYAWSILRCLGKYRPHPLEIRTDAESFSGGVLFAVVANSASYGGGIRLAPRARIDDGRLDICIVPYVGRGELLRWAPRAYWGEHLRHPGIKYFQARKVVMCSAGKMELFGDGEFLQELPAIIEVLPRSLRAIVPARRSGTSSGDVLPVSCGIGKS